MRVSAIGILVPLAFAAAGVAAGWIWLAPREGPGLDIRGPSAAGRMDVFRPDLPGELEAGDGKPAEGLGGSWPRFRGADFDGVSSEKVRLADRWDEGGPKVLWSVDLGRGYAGAAVHRGRVYVLDYDEQRKGDLLRCMSLADGRDIWRRYYHIPIRRQHGVSRTVPAVTDRYVLTLGPFCHVLCLDATSGDAKWSIDLVHEYGTVVPDWYAGQCPLIDTVDGKQRAILAPGGPEALMIAVDCETGKVLWRAPNPGKWRMSHSSIVPIERWGTRMYVYCSTGGVAGVSAKDGKVLWTYGKWKISPALAPSPVIVGDERVFLSGGYRAGSVMLEITDDDGGALVAKEVFRLDHKGFGAEQQTPVLYRDHIYGVLPGSAGELGQQLVCLNLDGARLWASGPQDRFGLGPFIIADGKLLIMNDSGVLTMARATPDGYERLARAKVLDGHDSWAPLAVAAGRLLARDLKRMVCLDLRAGVAK